MTPAQIRAALGALFISGVSIAGTWWAKGDGSPATIQITPPPADAVALDAAEVTKATSAALKAGAIGPITCRYVRPTDEQTARMTCSDQGTAQWWLGPAAQDAFIAAVKGHFPDATADSVITLSSSNGTSYDMVQAE